MPTVDPSAEHFHRYSVTPVAIIQFTSFIHVLDNSQTRPLTAKPKNNIRYIEMKDKETVFKENKTTETRANVGYEACT
jgi:hypothetical protein